MEETFQIVCPRCKSTIPNNPIIDSAVRGEFHGSSYVTCDCGETMTFWAITAQIRKQNTTGRKIRNWWRNFFKPRG